MAEANLERSASKQIRKHPGVSRRCGGPKARLGVRPLGVCDTRVVVAFAGVELARMPPPTRLWPDLPASRRLAAHL